MPELPDVELFRRFIDRHARGKTIERVRVLDAAMVKGVPPKELEAVCRGKKITATARHGKVAFARLGTNGWLALRFGMTGEMAYGRDVEPPRFTRIRFELKGGTFLDYVNMRKFGGVTLVASPEHLVAQAKLGPDALDDALTAKRFVELVGARHRAIKTVLLDQGVIAGIGNLWADEMLFQARIHPARVASDLRPDELKTLAKLMKPLLRKSIDTDTDFDRLPRTWLLRHREPGELCPRCRTPWAIEEIGGRTTYYCPREQR